MTSDSSSYETTYSEDERIEKELAKSKERRKREEQEYEEKRKRNFEIYYNDEKDKSTSIFNQPGIDFIRFNHKKIKFTFQPSEVAEDVSEKIKIFVSMRHVNKHWHILRDTIPPNIKMIAYKHFYKGDAFRTDKDITAGIIHIYLSLSTWANKESQYRKGKIEKFRAGEEVFLDTEDEEMFLNETEKLQLRSKKAAILRRMIPPPSTKKLRRRGRYFLR